jgi:hypothetical protein
LSITFVCCGAVRRLEAGRAASMAASPGSVTRLR